MFIDLVWLGTVQKLCGLLSKFFQVCTQQMSWNLCDVKETVHWKLTFLSHPHIVLFFVCVELCRMFMSLCIPIFAQTYFLNTLLLPGAQCKQFWSLHPTQSIMSLIYTESRRVCLEENNNDFVYICMWRYTSEYAEAVFCAKSAMLSKCHSCLMNWHFYTTTLNT